MTQIHTAVSLSLTYKPFNISEKAKYRFSCIVKYQKLREKGLTEKEALEIIEIKRSTLFDWLKKYRNKRGSTKNENNGIRRKIPSSSSS